MPNDNKKKRVYNIIFAAQIMSVSFIWVFVIGLTIWLVNLLLLSIELKDEPEFSMAISLVAIPVFWTLASVLTYVFVGLRRNRVTD
jgi:arginine exporter protein ArgO